MVQIASSIPEGSEFQGAGKTLTHTIIVRPPKNNTILAGRIVCDSSIIDAFFEDATEAASTPPTTWLEVAFPSVDYRTSVNASTPVEVGSSWSLVMSFHKQGETTARARAGNLKTTHFWTDPYPTLHQPFPPHPCQGFARWTTRSNPQTKTQLVLSILPAMAAVVGVFGLVFKYIIEPASSKCGSDCDPCARCCGGRQLQEAQERSNNSEDSSNGVELGRIGAGPSNEKQDALQLLKSELTELKKRQETEMEALLKRIEAMEN